MGTIFLGSVSIYLVKLKIIEQIFFSFLSIQQALAFDSSGCITMHV